MNQQVADDWTREEAIDFADYLFRYVATRRVVRNGRNALPLVSKHECKTAQSGTYRRTDLPERIYLAFEGLRRAGMDLKKACWTVAERLPDIGTGKKRGRRRRNASISFLYDKAKSVRNRVAAYERRSLRTTAGADLVRFVQYKIDQFRFVRRVGILVGSEFPQDSRARTMNWYYRTRERIYGIPVPPSATAYSAAHGLIGPSTYPLVARGPVASGCKEEEGWGG